MWFFVRIYRIFVMFATFFKSVMILAMYNECTIADHFRKQGAKIGKNCRIFIRDMGSEPYLIKLGDNVFISRGVVFHTHDGGVWIFRDEVPDIALFGPIIIEDNCIIGVNVMLLPNVRVGKNSIIGANSVVITDVPPNSLVMGVPARIFGSTQKYKEKCLAAWKDQKPSGYCLDKFYDWRISKKYKENSKKLRKHLTNIFDLHPPT